MNDKTKTKIILAVLAVSCFGGFKIASASTYIGSLDYNTTTLSAVNNIGESIGFASGTINSIYAYDLDAGQLQLRPCDSFITDPIIGFHLDIDLSSHCSGGLYWPTASSTSLGNGLRRFDVSSSSIATSTYTLNAGTVYALLWYNNNQYMKCTTTSTPNGKIFSNGSPNSTDDIGTCNDLPYQLVGDLTISTITRTPAAYDFYSCTYSGSFLGFPWPTGDDIYCFVRKDSLAVSDFILNKITDLISENLFPVSLFHHWNTLLDQVSTTGTVPAISITMPNGPEIKIMSSTTIAQASSEAGFDFRNFANKALYVVSAVVATGLGYLCFL